MEAKTDPAKVTGGESPRRRERQHWLGARSFGEKSGRESCDRPSDEVLVAGAVIAVRRAAGGVAGDIVRETRSRIVCILIGLAKREMEGGAVVSVSIGEQRRHGRAIGLGKAPRLEVGEAPIDFGKLRTQRERPSIRRHRFVLPPGGAQCMAVAVPDHRIDTRGSGIVIDRGVDLASSHLNCRAQRPDISDGRGCEHGIDCRERIVALVEPEERKRPCVACRQVTRRNGQRARQHCCDRVGSPGAQSGIGDEADRSDIAQVQAESSQRGGVADIEPGGSGSSQPRVADAARHGAPLNLGCVCSASDKRQSVAERVQD